MADWAPGPAHACVQEFETQVMSVYIERECAKQEAARKQRMQAARSAWVQLLQVRNVLHVSCLLSVGAAAPDVLRGSGSPAYAVGTVGCWCARPM